MIYIITLEIILISVAISNIFKKFWLFPFIALFLFNSSYFISLTIGQPSLFNLSLLLALIIIIIGKFKFRYIYTVFKKNNSTSLLFLFTIVLIGILTRLIPYLGTNLYPFVVGPNLDSINHSLRAQNFLLTEFDIYNSEKSITIAKPGINDIGLYPGGYHLIIAWLSLLFKTDVVKIIFPLTNILCGLGSYGYYFFLREKGFSKSTTLISTLLLGLGSNFVYWLYFSEYPAIISVYLFPAASIIFNEIVHNKKLSIKIIGGLLLIGYTSLHSYFILYFLLGIYNFDLIINQIFFKKNLKNLLITISIILVTSIPLTRNIISDFSFNKQTMLIEDSLQNPLSSRFWGNAFGISLPNLYCSPYIFNVANKFNQYSTYLYYLIPLFFLIYNRKNTITSLILVIILSYLRYANLESPYNRLCLFSSILFIPILFESVGKNKQISVIIRSIFASIYITTALYLSLITINSFNGDYLSSFNKNDYEFFKYLQNHINHKNLNILFEENSTGFTSNLSWLTKYYLYKVNNIDISEIPKQDKNQYDVIITTNQKEIYGFSKSSEFLNNYIYKKL